MKANLAHTFSIIGRDKESGRMGLAVQSHWFSVGTMVGWGEAGVGVVVTQSLVEPSYGPLGLALMRAGKTAKEALTGLLAADDGREMRQVAMMDAKGSVAVHTGKCCITDAGHETGDGFSVQANMMINKRVWGAMAEAYQQSTGDLAERMLLTLEAGQDAGGDIRGKQSACMLIVEAKGSGCPWVDRVLDLRVEDHPEPIKELRRLVKVFRAYRYMNEGDDRLAEKDIPGAMEAYAEAARLRPESIEIPFWQAVTLADLGRMEEALPIFRRVFKADANWAVLVQRLPAAGLLREDAKMMKQILEVNE